MFKRANVDRKYVDFCNNGLEAVNKVKQTYERGSKYSHIFMDFNMPVKNGLEAAKEISTYLQDIGYGEDMPNIIGCSGDLVDKNSPPEGMNMVFEKPLYFE